jgi:hypothetical protein
MMMATAKTSLTGGEDGQGKLRVTQGPCFGELDAHAACSALTCFDSVQDAGQCSVRRIRGGLWVREGIVRYRAFWFSFKVTG